MTAPRDVYAAICAARDAARSASREPNGGGCAVRRMMMRTILRMYDDFLEATA